VERRESALRSRFQERLSELDPKAEPNDKDYVFISFIMDHLPVGVIGLLLAMIFCAGMSSTSAGPLRARDDEHGGRAARPEERSCPGPRDAVGNRRVRHRLARVRRALLALREPDPGREHPGLLFYGTILGIFLVAFFVEARARDGRVHRGSCPRP
jgi:hypothetical protein